MGTNIVGTILLKDFEADTMHSTKYCNWFKNNGDIPNDWAKFSEIYHDHGTSHQ